MKKLIIILFAAVMVLLASCGDDTNTEIPTEAPTEQTDTAEPPTEPPTESPTEAPTETEEIETCPPVVCMATIDEIEFISSTNGLPLEGCALSVEGDTVHFGYPLIVSDDELLTAKLRITTGDGVNREIIEVTYDLRESHEITLTDADGISASYTIAPYRNSYGVPVMQIYTKDSAPILTKTDYVKGTLYIDGEPYPMKIRGRGNASWSQFPKKSYRIKLDDGAPLFGLTKNRDWVLVSNYADKSLIRNAVAHKIASALDGMDYTSTHFSVNLYLNGEYLGVYTFADKIEEGAGRLDFSRNAGDTPSSHGGMDIGFLCEIGWDFDSENVYNRDYFDAEKVVRIYVKEPESEVANTPEFTYVSGYILAMEQAIVTNNGWQDYIDLDSWVDWFIATELTFNMESAFYRSCYMWKREGGKLMLGPVWDFDMAFGNHYGDIPGYDGWCTTECEYEYLMENWMNYLITYDEFNDAVRSRWNEKKDELYKVALDAVNSYSAELEGSADQNFTRWPILTWRIGAGSVDPLVYDTYDKQVEYVRDFIEQRWSYMDERINREF